MAEPKTENPAYTPFLEALTLAHKKRHIHKIARVTTGDRDTKWGYFLEVAIKPHRSCDFELQMVFSSSSFIKVNVSTHSKGETTKHGALGDAMMLLGDIVTAWTTIVESAKPQTRQIEQSN